MNSQNSKDTDIAALAHRYYEEEGRPEGKAQEHWMRALQELERQTTSAPPSNDLQSEKERDTQASGKMG